MNDDKTITIIEKHSRILRWTHWINFPLLSIMIWSGVLIYWANDAYITIPENVSTFFSINNRLAEGMAWHFFVMWLYVINGMVYLTYMLISSEWKTLVPTKTTFKQVLPVILYELKLIKHAPPLEGKFNSAQKIAYSCAILMGIGTIITGLAIYKPVTLGGLTSLLGGYKAARFEHFLFMIGFVLFFIVHIIQVARAGWNNFRSMLAGYEIRDE